MFDPDDTDWRTGRGWYEPRHARPPAGVRAVRGLARAAAGLLTPVAVLYGALARYGGMA